MEKSPGLASAAQQHYRPTGFWAGPVSFAAYAHMVGEIIVPLVPQAMRPLSVATMGYFVLAAIDSSGKASSLEPAPELKRFRAVRAGVDVCLTGWFSYITLPSLVLGVTVGPLAAVLKENASKWNVPAPALRYIPSVVGAAAVSATLPLCIAASDRIMDWAVRPLLDAIKPQETTRMPSSNYEAPSPETLLIGAGAGALPGLEIDADDAARLRWAVDGNPASAFPGDAAARGGRAMPAQHAAEDAAFMAALASYAQRHTPQAEIAAVPSSDEDSDYDRALAAALEQTRAAARGRDVGGSLRR